MNVLSSCFSQRDHFKYILGGILSFIVIEQWRKDGKAWVKTHSKWPQDRFQVCGLSSQPSELNQCSNSEIFKTSFLTSRALSDPND